MECGLVHITKDGKYYSNYPENYINYSHYKYDADLEAKKDAKIFQLMKDNTDKKEYWQEHTYFSIDSFFSPEQTKELIDMFRAIKFKAKQFSHQNSEKGKVDGLSFRRLKFYDMILSLLVVFVIGLTGFSNKAMAGNDPGGSIMRPFNIAPLMAQDIEDMLIWHRGIYAAGGGNDPDVAKLLAFSNALIVKASVAIGGGHDPGGTATEDEVRSGGGHDPGVVDPEVCREQLEGVEGDLSKVSLACLNVVIRALIAECNFSEDPLVCEKMTLAIGLSGLK